MDSTTHNRALTIAELRLARWMLENGKPEARDFLRQLDDAEVTTWKCPCGCASINFQIMGQPEAPPGVHVLGDFLCGSGDSVDGIFIFESGGLLAGIEVYGLTGNAPSTLPAPPLQPFNGDDLRSKAVPV